MSGDTEIKSLADLQAISRSGIIVYAALRRLARDKLFYETTRKRIGKACGLSKDCITDGIKALQEAGWIKLSYGHGKNYVQWYRVTFLGPEFFPFRDGKNTATNRQQKASTYRRKKQSIDSGKNQSTSLTGRGTDSRPVRPASAGTGPSDPKTIKVNDDEVNYSYTKNNGDTYAVLKSGEHVLVEIGKPKSI